MLWFYRCPNCGQELNVDWPSRLERRTCRHCRREHFAPTPTENGDAYVSGHRWPPELEQAVVHMHGKTCAVPGCFNDYRNLVHRIPVAKGGRTSVANLVPLCTHHIELKGEQDWELWLAALEASDHRAVVASLEESVERPAPGMPDCSLSFPADARCHALAGWIRVPEDTPPGMRLLAARPFVCGPVRRLMLNYAWRRRVEGTSKVALIAWPHSESPDLAHINGNGTPYAERRHDGTAGDSGNNWLELDLPGAPGSCWVAVVALTDETGRLEMEECLLAGVE